MPGPNLGHNMKHITLDEITLIKIQEKNISSYFVSTTATDVTFVNSVTSRQKEAPIIHAG